MLLASLNDWNESRRSRETFSRQPGEICSLDPTVPPPKIFHAPNLLRSGGKTFRGEKRGRPYDLKTVSAEQRTKIQKQKPEVAPRLVAIRGSANADICVRVRTREKTAPRERKKGNGKRRRLGGVIEKEREEPAKGKETWNEFGRRRGGGGGKRRSRERETTLPSNPQSETPRRRDFDRVLKRLLQRREDERVRAAQLVGPLEGAGSRREKRRG